MQAFERAIALGVDGIEFDLQLSADGHLLIHHDARLKPEATRRDGVFLAKPTPRIDALALAELQNYDVGRLQAGSPYAARRPQRAHMDGAQIPSLAAFDKLLAEQTDSDFRAYAELKTDMRDAAAAEAVTETTAAVALVTKRTKSITPRTTVGTAAANAFARRATQAASQVTATVIGELIQPICR